MNLINYRNHCFSFLNQKWNLKSRAEVSLHSSVQNIIKSIHTIRTWPIMLKDATDYDGYIFHQFQGFIFILLENNLLDMKDNKIMSNLSLPKARILVIVLGVTTNIQIVFDFLVEFSLHKAVVLLQNKGEKLEILSWSRDDCGDFKNITFLTSCNDVSETNLVHQIIERPKTYKGCRWHLYAIHEPPFNVKNELEFVTSGIELELLGYVASHFNFTVEQPSSYEHFIRKNLILFGSNANFPISTSLFAEIYYTQTYTWFLPRVGVQPHWSNVTRVFKVETWACVLFSLIIVSAFLKVLNIANREDTVTCFLNTWAVFLNVAFKQLPSNVRLRILFFSWVITSVALTTVFQSFMTSFFIDPGKGHQIDTIEELLKSDLNLSIGLHENSIHCWQTMLEIIYDFLTFTNECSMLNYSVRNANIAFLVSEEVFLFNFRSLGMLNRTSYFHKFSNGVINVHRSINMDITSPYLRQVNTVIKRLVESGIVDKIVDNYVDPTGLWKQINSGHRILEDYVPLSLFHLLSSFIYLCLGFIMSFVVFVAEIITNYCVNHK
ncbi:hypothetical protein L9F63_024121 [Diploptera punctata]|uniref:Uncharacterized protein n=1 Tax=Diploptera punctata TaxID=6984 RepID=A0AAD7ZHQ8_DIPPU|nr:hypothetical protein L9F63_024121 [Diploptera punctata]